jgi:hypothetical protein
MSLFVYPHLQPNPDLLLVLDNESEADHAVGPELRQEGHLVLYEDPPPIPMPGHVRQQWSNLWADRLLDRLDPSSSRYRYVGFLDTDTLFVAPTLATDLFTGPRPRIIATVGSLGRWWDHAAAATVQLLGGEGEVMRCMSMFPIIVHRAHLASLRAAVEAAAGTGESFDVLYSRVANGGPSSQFNLMCQHLWQAHRDDYEWHVQPTTGPSPRLPPASANVSALLASRTLTEPLARVAVHAKYIGGRKVMPNATRIESLLTAGVCECAAAGGLRPLLFEFEGVDWTWDPRWTAASRAHCAEREALPVPRAPDGSPLAPPCPARDAHSATGQ